jgi:citrate synthase
MSGAGISTEIASHDLHHVWVRGHDLTDELMGRVSFSDMVFLLVGGRLPGDQDRRLIDAILVSLVEHGLTPSAMVSRVTYAIAPEALQGAVAAGLLGAGSLLLGSMEECGELLERVDTEVQSGVDADEAVRAIVAEYRAARRRLPGLGHSIHTDGDPRAARLRQLAAECGRDGRHLAHLAILERIAESVTGKRLPINATGAIAAILLELGIPWRIHRGFALISRTAGLIAHIDEEVTAPITPGVRNLLREAGSAHGGRAAVPPDGVNGHG